MITMLVLVSLVALFGLSLPNLLRPMAPRPDRAPPRGDAPAAPTEPFHDEALTSGSLDLGPVPTEPFPGESFPGEAVHPESMTAELDPGDEEYLAYLADALWPDDEYAELEHTTDGEEEPGGSGMRL